MVARALLGKYWFTATAPRASSRPEAYLGIHDRAAHAWRGPTPRTQVLFGPPGHAYVYLIYGMYECLNFSAEPEGSAGCVLIRALEPLSGIEEMRTRRGPLKRDRDLANGPGKLTIAMGITRAQNGVDVTHGALRVCDADDVSEVGVSPRIGIKHNTELLLRFFIPGNPCVSAHPRMPY